MNRIVNYRLRQTEKQLLKDKKVTLKLFKGYTPMRFRRYWTLPRRFKVFPTWYL